MFGPDVPSLAKQVIAYCEGRDLSHFEWLLWSNLWCGEQE